MTSETKIREVIGNRVVLRRDPAEQLYGGRIVIPETANPKRPTVGTVVAIGPGLPTSSAGARVALQCKVGDRVLFGLYAGSEFKIEDDELIVMPETEVFCILATESAITTE